MTTVLPKDYLAIANTKYPDKAAVIFRNRTISYSALDAAATVAAQQLMELGVQPGDYVLLPLPNSPGLVTIFFAAVYCQAIPFIVPADLSPEVLRSTIADVPVDFAIVEDTHPLIGVHNNAMPIGKLLSLRTHDYEVSIEIVWENSDIFHHHPHSPEQDSGRYFMRLTTSGSSGVRKHVLRTAAEMEYAYKSLEHIFAIFADAVILDSIPPFHIGGIGMILWSTYLGATLVLEPSFIPQQVLSDISQYHVTAMIASPFVFKLLAQSHPAGTPLMQSLTAALCTGAPLDAETYQLVRDRCQIPLHQLYGATEVIFATTLPDTGTFTPGLVGRPVPGTSIKIFDDEGHEVAAGQIGAIGMASPSTVDQYLIGDRVSRDGFLNSYVLVGDRGYVDGDGAVHFIGRSNLIINVGGTKVDIAEVEQALSAHSEVAEVAVYGLPRGNTEVVAAVVVPRTSTLTAEALMAWAKQQLLPIKVPKQITFLASLPRDKNGKVNRQGLQSQSPQT